MGYLYRKNQLEGEDKVYHLSIGRRIDRDTICGVRKYKICSDYSIFSYSEVKPNKEYELCEICEKMLQKLKRNGTESTVLYAQKEKDRIINLSLEKQQRAINRGVEASENMAKGEVSLVIAEDTASMTLKKFASSKGLTFKETVTTSELREMIDELKNPN